MQSRMLRYVPVLLLGLPLTGGCSKNSPVSSANATGDSIARVEERDGVVMCVFGESGREYKLGKVDQDQVALFSTYGGGTFARTALEQAVSRITRSHAEEFNGREEQQALLNAIVSDRLPGIWKAAKASTDGKAEVLRDDDPIYLVIRADKTFRVIKKGRKPEGTWSLNSEGELQMDATNDQPMTAGVAAPSNDTLQLSMNDNGRQVVLQYVRTDLTEEPKAIDE